MKALLTLMILLIPTITLADELSDLFASLTEADSRASATKIERQIWGLWGIGPTESDTTALNKAAGAMNSGEFTLALMLLDRLIEQTPSYAEAWNKRATLYYMMGDFEKSIADIEQTVLLEPRHFGAWSGLAMMFEQLNRPDAAIKAHETVLDIYPLSMFSQQKIDQLRQQQLDKSI